MRYAIALLAALIVGCDYEEIDDPQPPPISDPVATAHLAMVTRAHSIAALDRDVAARIESGEIKTAEQMTTALNAGIKQIASEVDGKIIGPLWDDVGGGSDFDPVKAAKLLNQQAEGFSQVR